MEKIINYNHDFYCEDTNCHIVMYSDTQYTDGDIRIDIEGFSSVSTLYRLKEFIKQANAYVKFI